MRKKVIFFLSLFIFSFIVRAFGADSNGIGTVEEKINQQGTTIEEQRALSSSDPASAANNQPTVSEDVQQQIKEMNEKLNEIIEAQKKVLPSEFNPAIGLVGETLFSYRSRGSLETGSARPGGFDVFQRSVELDVAGSVDPFATAYVVINGSADAQTGELVWGAEEAALQTTSLPWNLTVKAGRFFGEFGRLAYIHDHELPFVNRPLALDQYIGGESRTDGIQFNWLVPIEHYVSLTLGAGNQFGANSPNPNNPGDYRPLGGLNYWGRLSTYFDLTPDISLEPGISGLWNPSTVDRGGAMLLPDSSTLTERERRLAGMDLTLSYKPLSINQFNSLTWGTEVLYSDNRYDVNASGPLSSRSVGSTGLYSYLTYKWHRQWSAGFLYEWLEDMQDNEAKTFAYSPYITWTISHWNQLRLQYTYTDHSAESSLRSDHAVYVQWAWIIGSHAHGWQQR